MTDETATLGTTLKMLRQFAGKPLKAVATDASISTAYLQKLEKDDVVTPSPHVLHRLSEVLGADYTALMRAAGYVVPTATAAQGGALAQAFNAKDLTEDEARAVATYLTMYRRGQES